MKKACALASCTLLLVTTAWIFAQESLLGGDEQMSDVTETQHYSYAVGLDIGNNFRNNATQLDLEKFLAGVQDGINDGEPLYDEKTCAMAIQKLQMQMQEKAQKRQQSQGAKNQQLGEEFLAKNKENDDVEVTETGLQYKVIESGDGPSPGPADTVSCHYRGTLIDGTEFDASANHGGPAQFPVNRVIPGWTEALQMMHVGDKWQLYIPAELAYSNNPPGPPIEAGSTLIFDIELLEIVGQ